MPQVGTIPEPVGAAGMFRRRTAAVSLIPAALWLACAQPAQVRSVTLRLGESGLLEEVERLNLVVYDAEGLSCRSDGELEGSPGDPIVDMRLTVGERAEIEIEQGRRVFLASGYDDADSRIAAGCSDARLRGGQTVDIEIIVHRVVLQGVCGNAALEENELCDDGNLEPGDGCDASCASEEGSLPQITEGAQRTPVAAGSSDGLFVIAWFDDGDDLKPLLVTFRDEGLGRLSGGSGNDRDVNRTAPWDPVAPAVAASPAGSAIVWEDHGGGNTDYLPGEPAGDPPDVKGRFYDADGRERAPDLLVNMTLVGQQSAPAVGMLETGQTMVVWRDESVSPASIAGRLFAAGGQAQGEVDIAITEGADANDPSVCQLGDSFAVIYRAAGVRVRIISATGATVGDVIEMGASVSASSPAIGSLSDGSIALVAWVEEGALLAQLLTADGALSGEPFSVSSGRKAAAPAVDGGSVFAVVWQALGDIHGRLVDPDGGFAFNRVNDDSTEFLINQATDEDQLVPSVAVVGDVMLAVWQDDGVRPEDDSPPGIRYRTFSIAAPR